MERKPALPDMLGQLVFISAVVMFSIIYGFFAQRFNWFPSEWIRQAEVGWHELRDRPWYYFDTEQTEGLRVYQRQKMAPGLTLVSMITQDRGQVARVVDGNGKTINEWNIDWFRVWPDATHLSEGLQPQTPPGAVVHGMLMMEDGGIVYNYDALGLVRLDACGNPLWRLPAGTHHSLHRDESGDIWTSIRYPREPGDPTLPGYRHPYDEYTIARISPDGEVLEEVSIFDLLKENGLESLLYLSSSGDQVLETGGDTLHVNDVEVFPASLEPGLFQPGDIMVSMRTINAIIVFNWQDRSVRYMTFSPFIRQHDPDFIDGNTISLFDNNNIGRPADGVFSRIVVKSVIDDSVSVPFGGNETFPFFSAIMGKHQYLDNGNLLLVEATAGRILEVDNEGQPVWQYVNLVEEDTIGLVAEGIRLPAAFTPEFFTLKRSECGGLVL